MYLLYYKHKSVINIVLDEIVGTRKDKIDQCKDCEFRYACMDCRCFLKEADNPLSKRAKCKYNPYEL